MLTANKQFIIRKVIKLRAMAFFKFMIALVVFNAFFILDATAQRDVIVTQANEEIRCRILDESPTRFVYAYVGLKGTILRNEIFKNLVKSFSYNKYDSDLILLDAKTKKRNKKKSLKEDKEEATKAEKIQEDSKDKAEKLTTELANIPVLEDESIENSPAQEIESKRELRKKEKELEKENKRIEKEALNLESTKISKDKANPKLDEAPKTEESTADKIAPKTSERKDLKVNTPKTETNKEVEKQAVPIQKSPAPVISSNPVVSTGEFKNYLKWRVGVKAGIGNILDNGFEATNAYGLYQEKLLKGWTFGADLAFFPMESFGLGVVYTDFKSSNAADNITYLNKITDAEMTGSISNKVSRKFIGPAVFLRKSIDFKTFVVLGVSPGMYFYSDKGDYNGANFNFTGKQFGAAATLGLDFLLGNDIIGRDIILSLEAGYNSGKLNDIDYGDGKGMLTLDNPIIMDRLDFSIGLRFMRFPKYLKKEN